MPDSPRTTPFASILPRLGLAALLALFGAAAGRAPLAQEKPAPSPAPQTSGKTAPASKESATKPKPARPKTPAAEPVPKFTNDDLPKLSGAPAEDEETAPTEPAGDTPGARAKKPKAKTGEGAEDGDGEGRDLDSVLNEEERAAKTILLQRQIADAEKRLEQLESRRRALQNPLHSGLFKAGDDEQAAVGGQGNDVRLAWVEDQIRATRQAIARDREELASLQTTP